MKGKIDSLHLAEVSAGTARKEKDMKKLMFCAMILTFGAGALRAEDAFIQSNGSNWINTGYHASGKTKISVDFQMVTVKSSSDCVIGHYSGANFTVLIYVPGTTKSIYAEMRDGTHAGNSELPGTKGDTERHTIVIDGPHRTADMYAPDGTSQSHLDFPTDWTLNNTATFPLLLFSFLLFLLWIFCNGRPMFKL